MKFLSKQSRNNGFTLIETLVALTILLVGVLGPLSLAARGIIDARFAKNQLTANYLAQEALDTVVNIRLANVNDSDPLGTIPLRLVNGSVTLSASGRSANGQFSNTPLTLMVGASTEFTQSINIESFSLPQQDISSREGRKVTVTISWNNLAQPRNLSMTSYLYPKGVY